MATAFIENRCTACGKKLSNGDNAIILGDIRIQESGVLQFTAGMDTRNVYCSVFCVQKDLTSYINMCSTPKTSKVQQVNLKH